MSQSVTVFPYRSDGRWVFDVVHSDERKQQPLGLDAILDELTASIEEAAAGVELTLTDTRVAETQAELIGMSSTDVLGWRLFQATLTTTVGFASPALLEYFKKIPDKLYASAGKL
jgi:hypothetical protein